MKLILIVFVIVFAILPTDAQYWLAGLIGSLLTGPYAPYFAAGGLGAALVAGPIFVLGHNSAVNSEYREALDRARANRKRRLK